MAFLCPMRIPRRKKKKNNTENSSKNGTPKARLTGSNSVDSLMVAMKTDGDEDDDFEPSKMVILHDFIPCVEDETPVKRNEHVKALYQENDWIYVVKEDGQEGFVPFTYCISQEDYNERKLKAKTTSTQTKRSTSQEHFSVTFQNLTPLEFSKENYGEFIVKFDFNAIDEDDVSVRKGEFVVVLNKDDQDWFWVKKKNGKEGFVPKDFVSKVDHIMSKNSIENGLRSRSTPNFNVTDRKAERHHARSSLVPASNDLQLPREKIKESYHVDINNNNNTNTVKALSKHSTPIKTVHYSYKYPSAISTDAQPYDSVLSDGPDWTQGSITTPILKTSNSQSILPASSPRAQPMSSAFSNASYADKSLIYHSKSHEEPFYNKAEQIQSSKGRISMLSQKRNQEMTRKDGTAKFSLIQNERFSTARGSSGIVTHVSGAPKATQRKNSNDLLLNGEELVCTDTYIAHKTDELTVYKGDWIYADKNSKDLRGWLWAYSPSTSKQGFVPKYCFRPPATTPL